MGYTYADGSNNDKRTLSVIYPDLREIEFDYGAPGSDDDLLSRFGGLEDAGGSLVKYTYFGVDTFCEQEYPETAVKLSYNRYSRLQRRPVPRPRPRSLSRACRESRHRPEVGGRL